MSPLPPSSLYLPRFGLLLGLTLAAAGMGCYRSPGGKTPADASAACGTNADCPSGQICVSGSCTAGCSTDSDCPNAGICHPDGTCGPRPACVQDTDCAAGFVCNGGNCSCTTDYSCWTADGGLPDTSQICVSGVCQTSSSCTQNSDCTDGRYCGPIGVCSAPCQSDTDCGGSSQFGAALTCSNGMCVAPCIADSTPTGFGGCNDGQICEGNLCQPAQCATQADCDDPTLLCTDPNHGRCVSFTLCNPSAVDSCGPLATCAQYPPNQCPPGFDCSQYVCQTLPACFVDAQCQQGQICEMGACQTSAPCQTSADCAAGDCVGGQCVAHVCRGPSDCDGGVCSGGACVAPDTGADILSVRLLTRLSTLEVGAVVQLEAVAITASGATMPVSQFVWSVSPAGLASVSTSGLLTAQSPGAATLTVGFTRADGTQATPDTDAFEIVPPLDAGAARVVVVDSASGDPIASAQVVICTAHSDGGACASSQALTTQMDGSVSFAAPTSAFDVSAADPALDASGNPIHDVVHLLGIRQTDVLVPLPGNLASGAAGFEASVDFTQVHTTGQVQVALAGSSIADLASFQLQDLLGQTWTSSVNLSNVMLPSLPGLPGVPGLPGLPGIPDGGVIQVPDTGGLVANVISIAGVAVTLPIKDTVYALGDPGLHVGWTFAGELDAQLFFGSITSSAQGGTLGIVPFLGAFDHGLRAPIDESELPLIANTADLDGSGNTSEMIANYGAFPDVTFHPSQPQSLEAQIDVPASPGQTGQIIVLAGAQVPGTGLLPLGLTSTQAAGVGGPATTSVVLQMAPLYGGLEASDYAVAAIATARGGQQVPTVNPDGGSISTLLDGGAPPAPTTTGAQTSMIVARAQTLPTDLSLQQPFLPFFSNAGYDIPSQVWTAGDSLPSLQGAAQVLRLTLVGAHQRAFVYASPAAIAGPIRVPNSPGPAAFDPAQDPQTTAVVAAMTTNGPDLDGLAALSGPTLLHLSDVTNAVVRSSVP